MQRLGVDQRPVEVEQQRGSSVGRHAVANSRSPAATDPPTGVAGDRPLRPVHRDDRDDGETSCPLAVDGSVDGSQRTIGSPAATVLALGDEHLEALALEAHGVDAEVDEDADAVVAEHDERVRVAP